MSKNKDKKPKEVKEESKAPSAEVSENGAKVETEAGKEEELKFDAEMTLLAIGGFIGQAQGLLSIIDIDQDHHNKLVIDIGVSDAMKAIGEVVKHLAFIEKALSEKKK